jgi:hypothetical protein
MTLGRSSVRARSPRPPPWNRGPYLSNAPQIVPGHRAPTEERLLAAADCTKG